MNLKINKKALIISLLFFIVSMLVLNIIAIYFA